MKDRIIGKVILFYLLTFVFTIVLGGLMHKTGNMFASPQFAPTISLVLVCLFGRSFLPFMEIEWNIFKTSRWFVWALVSLLIPLAVISMSSLVLPLFGLNYSS